MNAEAKTCTVVLTINRNAALPGDVTPRVEIEETIFTDFFVAVNFLR